MKYFYDTEFIEDGRTIDLISIGVVAEDGREFYAQNDLCGFTEASPWVQDNVFPHLKEFDLHAYRPLDPDAWLSPPEIAQQLIAFIGDDKPEWWGYYADYDHVALCQLFGTMMELPKDWPMYTRDLKQLCVDLGDPPLPTEGKDEHHALADARWNKRVYEYLLGGVLHLQVTANLNTPAKFPSGFTIPVQAALIIARSAQFREKDGSNA